MYDRLGQGARSFNADGPCRKVGRCAGIDLGTGRAESFQAVADATLAYHKKGSIEYIPFPDKLKGRYQAFTQADLTNLRAAGYDKPFKTVAEGVTEYMAWLNRDA